jgi:hypothetical protein
VGKLSALRRSKQSRVARDDHHSDGSRSDVVYACRRADRPDAEDAPLRHSKRRGWSLCSLHCGTRNCPVGSFCAQGRTSVVEGARAHDEAGAVDGVCEMVWCPMSWRGSFSASPVPAC